MGWGLTGDEGVGEGFQWVVVGVGTFSRESIERKTLQTLQEVPRKRERCRSIYLGYQHKDHQKPTTRNLSVVYKLGVTRYVTPVLLFVVTSFVTPDLVTYLCL